MKTEYLNGFKNHPTVKVSNRERENLRLTLVIQTFPDLGTARLVSVNSKFAGFNESSIIEFYDKNGQYILNIGGINKVVDETQLSDELKSLLNANYKSEKTKKSLPSLIMPSKADLSRRNNYMLFSAYKAEVNLRENKLVEGDKSFSKRFPKLPKEIYVELVRQYLKEDGYPHWHLYYDRTY